jgi:hypothetical protein
MTRRWIAGLGAGTIFCAAATVWLTLQDEDQMLPEPNVPHTLCAFPVLDFQELRVGMTEQDLAKRFGEPAPARPRTRCVAYRYEPYLFDGGSPTVFITVLIEDGKVTNKWLQPRTPNRTECRLGLERVVDIGDLMIER